MSLGFILGALFLLLSARTKKQKERMYRLSRSLKTCDRLSNVVCVLVDQETQIAKEVVVPREPASKSVCQRFLETLFPVPSPKFRARWDRAYVKLASWIRASPKSPLVILESGRTHKTYLVFFHRPTDLFGGVFRLSNVASTVPFFEIPGSEFVRFVDWTRFVVPTLAFLSTAGFVTLAANPRVKWYTWKHEKKAIREAEAKLEGEKRKLEILTQEFETKEREWEATKGDEEKAAKAARREFENELEKHKEKIKEFEALVTKKKAELDAQRLAQLKVEEEQNARAENQRLLEGENKAQFDSHRRGYVVKNLAQKKHLMNKLHKWAMSGHKPKTKAFWTCAEKEYEFGLSFALGTTLRMVNPTCGGWIIFVDFPKTTDMCVQTRLAFAHADFSEKTFFDTFAAINDVCNEVNLACDSQMCAFWDNLSYKFVLPGILPEQKQPIVSMMTFQKNTTANVLELARTFGWKPDPRADSENEPIENGEIIFSLGLPCSEVAGFRAASISKAQSNAETLGHIMLEEAMIETIKAQVEKLEESSWAGDLIELTAEISEVLDDDSGASWQTLLNKADSMAANGDETDKRFGILLRYGITGALRETTSAWTRNWVKFDFAPKGV